LIISREAWSIKVFGYTRVSTNDQNIDGQKGTISHYCMGQKILVDEWFEVAASSRKSLFKRRIEELIEKLSEDDVIVVTELSRLGRSIKEALNLIELIVQEKKARLIFVKQNLDLNPNNTTNPTNKILITIFSMMAELERDFISERTKAGLQARKAKGIKLGKPKGTIQASMYDKDKERIMELYRLDVPVAKIVDTHLSYGKYLSLKKYIERRKG
jgi:DNA invertase Pin-like site-specific DNA recombinase